MSIIKIKNQAIDLDAAEIPNLPATKITSGTFDNARISLDAAEIPNLDTAKITTGTLADARVPSLNASKITAGTLADARLPANALNSNVSVPNQSAFKNIIINGDMSLAQRATSVTGITGAGYNTADRFYLNMGTAGTWTNTISTDVPTGQGFAKSFKLDCTTANASLSAGSYMTVQQRFEGQNLQYIKKGTSSAESLTLSFWVKSNKTGTYIALLKDNDNGRDISKSYTISSANTWEKKTITFPGDTSGALGNDNGASLMVYFWLVAGSTYQSGSLQTSWNSTDDSAVGQVNLADSTSNEWYVTGVQLEAGTTASEFEFLPVDVNTTRCFRYFFKNTGSGGNIGYAPSIGDDYRHELYFYPQEMRASPTLTVSWSGGLGNGVQYNGTKTADVFVNMGNTTTIVRLVSIQGTAEL